MRGDPEIFQKPDVKRPDTNFPRKRGRPAGGSKIGMNP